MILLFKCFKTCAKTILINIFDKTKQTKKPPQKLRIPHVYSYRILENKKIQTKVKNLFEKTAQIYMPCFNLNKT